MSMLLRRRYDVDIQEETGVTNAVAPVPVKEETKAEAKAKAESDADKIKSMSGAAIRKYAKENGIKNHEEYTVKELKELLLGESESE